MMNDLLRCHCYCVGGISDIITVSVLHTKRLSIPIQFSSAYVSSTDANKIFRKTKNQIAVRIHTTYPTKSRNLATGILVDFAHHFWRWKKKHGPTASPGPPLSTKAGSFLHWLVLKGWWLVVPRSEKYDGQIGSCRIRGENNTYA